MHHRKTLMHINFQQNRVSRSVKTAHANLFVKKLQFHTHTLSDYREKKLLTQTDGQTDGRHDGRTDVAYDNNK